MIKFGIFILFVFFVIAFIEMQVGCVPVCSTFSETSYSNYPIWLTGIILIIIGYYRKSKSDEHAKELKEKSKDKK